MNTATKPSVIIAAHISSGWDLLQEVLQLKPTHKLHIQVVRSLVVSILSLIFDFGLLLVFKQLLGINYLIAATMSFLVGVAVNYGLSVYWVFADRKLTSRKAEAVVFLIITGIGLILNLVIIAILVEQLHIDYRVGKIISTVVVFFWNFIIRKKILY